MASWAVTTTKNPQRSTSAELSWSLWLALEWGHGPVTKLGCSIYFNPSALEERQWQHGGISAAARKLELKASTAASTSSLSAMTDMTRQQA